MENFTAAHTDHPLGLSGLKQFSKFEEQYRAWQNLRVIELGQLAVLQRRDLIAMGLLVEGRTRHRSGIPKSMN